jgi:glutamate racemase
VRKNAYLGSVDWGIGGISIHKLIRERLGPVPTIYFSDTGVTPYGRMTRPELVARLDKVIEYLRSQGVTHLVIGCNAASTAIPFLNKGSVEMAGVIESAVRLTQRARPERLGLIGGRRTVLAGVYRRAFAEAGIDVSQRIAQPLSGMIENGDVSSPALRDECRKILAPLRSSSHILLACTHYPAIMFVMRGLVSPETVFIDPADELVSEISRWNLPRGDEAIFLTSGDTAKMKEAAGNAFGVIINKVKKVKLPESSPPWKRRGGSRFG